MISRKDALKTLPDRLKNGEMVAVDMPRIESPFVQFGDSITHVIERTYLQLGDAYKAPKLGTPMSLDDEVLEQLPFAARANKYYFVGDSQQTYCGNGVFAFYRQFAPIPKSHTDYAAVASWQRPGITAGTLKIPVEVIGDFGETRLGDWGHNILLREIPPRWDVSYNRMRCKASWYAYADPAHRWGNKYQWGNGTIVFNDDGTILIKNVYSGDGVTIAVASGKKVATINTASDAAAKSGLNPVTLVPENMTARSCRQENTPAYKVYKYYKSDDPMMLNLRATPFYVADKDGNEVADLSTSTSPSFTTYEGWVDDKKPILVGWDMGRWLGNIYYTEETYIYPYF